MKVIANQLFLFYLSLKEHAVAIVVIVAISAIKVFSLDPRITV